MLAHVLRRKSLRLGTKHFAYAKNSICKRVKTQYRLGVNANFPIILLQGNLCLVLYI
jgi:hypothetical protein